MKVEGQIYLPRLLIKCIVIEQNNNAKQINEIIEKKRTRGGKNEPRIWTDRSHKNTNSLKYMKI